LAQATVGVQKVYRVVASVAGEVPVVTVDHGQAGAERSKVEMPARSAKVAKVWRRS
jgi:hypothetical protein